MELIHDSAGTRMVAFPPRRLGVLVPRNDRRSAALGMTMYTASKPWVILVQRLAHGVVRTFGAGALPCRRVRWSAPMGPDEWAGLRSAWTAELGAIDQISVYRRRQSSREGLTMLATRGEAAPVVVKLRRGDDGSLAREQAALAHVATFRPAHFDAPRPVAFGTSGPWQWSAQAAVFSRPHRPCLHPPVALFDELASCLATMPAGPGAAAGHEAVQHGDLTPWNLRVDHRRQIWLFDWENVAALPVDADRAYFHAAVAALTGGHVDAELAASVAQETWDHWRNVVATRGADNEQDLALSRRLAAELSSARRAATPTRSDRT